MKKIFINSVASISPQKTFENDFFFEDEKVIFHYERVISATDPVYKEYIPPAAARRMAKGIKMGVVASQLAMKEANVETVDAIITGTGMGCMIDSEKFVSAIIDNNEQYLTPTSFIQSTHNTVAGQIALGIKCKAYNFTYVHSSLSFESALLDAKLQLENDEAANILVGGVEELGDHTTEVHSVIHHIKSEPVSSSDILKAETKGAVFSEGAHFFVVSNEKSDSCYAELVDLKLYNTLEENRIKTVAEEFLKNNNLSPSDIDVVILGNNGDSDFDYLYHPLSEDLFKETQQVYYKHLAGENHTVSAFSMWLGSKILENQYIPEAVKMNKIDETNSEIKYILCYNQYRGKDHSFILLKKC